MYPCSASAVEWTMLWAVQHTPALQLLDDMKAQANPGVIGANGMACGLYPYPPQQAME
jgi:hypothetical protein